MESAGGNGRGRWGVAVALSAATLFLPALESFSLVALSLSILLFTLAPREIRAFGLAAALLVWVFVLFPATDAWSLIGRGWSLVVGGLFAATVLLWPGWSFVSRALAALAAAALGTGVWLGATGTWSELSWLASEHFRSVSLLASTVVATRVEDAPWMADFVAAMARYADWQGAMFPALVALQSLAALGLAWWAFVRLGTREGGCCKPLRPLREFRFNDQLVWIVVAGLVLILLPLGGAAARAGANALLFMGSLYALRGVAVFVFLAGRAPSLLSVAVGALAAIILYPLVLTAALLVGLGDTWLDVRGRVTLASRV